MKTYKLKVGDYITAHHKGIHKITKIVPRDNYEPLISYVTILNSNGDFVSSNKEKCCDGTYCKPAINYLYNLEFKVDLIKTNFKKLNILT